MDKVLAAVAIIVGGLDSILNVAVAFGAHVTPDQHTAIASVGGLLLLVVGLWFHPDVPVGQKGPVTP